jgi:guanosine-3',5'-bis(diphosphate) 3'-pyrophosphohydrolase
VADAPDFIAGRKLVADAYEHALRAHREAPGGSEKDIEHPVEVARLLDGSGFGDEVVAAALLHEVVEDTSEPLDEIEEAFGPEVRGLVEAMTENAAIEPYEDRKGEHRERVLAAGAGPASIYAADKLARVRSFSVAGEPVAMERLEHYWDTLELFAARRPELPFLAELAEELPELRPAPES